jgi:hypothetical protein
LILPVKELSFLKSSVLILLILNLISFYYYFIKNNYLASLKTLSITALCRFLNRVLDPAAGTA